MTIPVYLYLTAVIMGSNSSFDFKKISQLLNKVFSDHIFIFYINIVTTNVLHHTFFNYCAHFQSIEITFIHIMIARTTCTCQTLTGYHDL